MGWTREREGGAQMEKKRCVVSVFSGPRGPGVGRMAFILFFLISLCIAVSGANAQLCECKGCHGPQGPHAGGFPSGCNVCHGNPPLQSQTGIDGLVGYPSPTGATTAGGHTRHATSDGYNFDCQTCHFNGMPVTIIAESPPLLQMGFNYLGAGGGTYDGFALLSPYAYDATNGTTVTTNGTMTCSNIYCHSNGTSVSTGIIPASSSPSWSTPGPLPCNTCHGYPPQYAQDQPKSNSHIIHKSQLQQNPWFNCGTCHYTTTTDGVSIGSVLNHVNGTYDVNPNPADVTFTYTYAPGGGKCTNITCHGSAHPGFTNVWGGIVLNPTISVSQGPACYQVTLIGNPNGGTAPYTYSWEFGDGATEETTQNIVSHTYANGNAYYVRLTVTDAKFHEGSSITTVTPVPANTPPVAANSVTASVLTVTLTDKSFDTDYNGCGHSGGAGTITINWGDTQQLHQSLQLNASPSNAVFTHTYASSGTYTIRETITDNSGTQSTVTPDVTVTVPPSTVGTLTITTSPILSGVSIFVRQGGLTKASGSTDATGTKSFALPAGTYQVSLFYPTGHGCTFTNGSNWTVTAGNITTVPATACH